MAAALLRLKGVGLACLGATLVTFAGCSLQPAGGNNDAVRLGESLFFDPGFSSDGQVSCASCHDPKRAFTDGRSVSIGVRGRTGTRNAPSLLEIGDLKSFFWDGRETRLEQVVLQPFTNPNEMGLSGNAELLLKLKTSRHREAFEKAFGENEGPSLDDVSKALSAYLESIQTKDGRPDRFSSASSGTTSSDEMAGLDLFRGKAGCAECHKIDSNFADNRFHHTGIGFEAISGNIQPLIMRLDELKRLRQPIGIAILADRDIAELGKFAFTQRPADLGAFRTPSLRNAAVTAPYMHDGSVRTLEEAIEREIYYRSLSRGRPISLTVEERRQLHAYISSLNDL